MWRIFHEITSVHEQRATDNLFTPTPTPTPQMSGACVLPTSLSLQYMHLFIKLSSIYAF
jgi:hypothetical protein